MKTTVTTTVLNFKAILKIKHARGSRAGPSTFLTISDSRSTTTRTATIFHVLSLALA